MFVRQRPTIHHLARNRFGRAYRETGKDAYDVEMRQLGLIPGPGLVEIGPVVPPEDAAKRLELGADERALIRRRRMYASDEPMRLATSYMIQAGPAGGPASGGRPRPAAPTDGARTHASDSTEAPERAL